MVLTKSSDKAEVNTAIENGYTINNLAVGLINKMDESYKKSEKSGKENYFEVGTKGNFSKTVDGNVGEVTAAQRAEARRDLVEQNDTYEYDVHPHPIERDKDGKVTHVGNPTASEEDITFSKSKASIVLGYVENITPAPPSQIGTSGASASIEYIKTVGFFNSSGQVNSKDGKPLTISYKSFVNLIKKMNK